MLNTTYPHPTLILPPYPHWFIMAILRYSYLTSENLASASTIEYFVAASIYGQSLCGKCLFLGTKRPEGDIKIKAF
jgi:hypothetical protein